MVTLSLTNRTPSLWLTYSPVSNPMLRASCLSSLVRVARVNGCQPLKVSTPRGRRARPLVSHPEASLASF